MRTAQTVLIVAWTLILLSGCATTGEKVSRLGDVDVSREMVLEESPLARGTENLGFREVDLLEMTPEMIEWVESYMDGAGNRYKRMQRLVYAIIGDGNFDLVYDDKTRTASETFRDARGNCLSFTNLFIAMARYLEVHAEYQ